MIGLALVTGFSVMFASVSKSVNALVDETLGADSVVSTTVQQPFSPAIAEQMRAVDGVESVTQQRYAIVQVGKAQEYISAVDADSLSSVGERAPVTFQSGTARQPKLSGTFAMHEVLGPLVLSLETLTAVGGSTQDRFVYVNSAKTPPRAGSARTWMR